MSTDLIVTPAGVPMAFTAQEIRAQKNLIQEVMRDCMKAGEHFGKIPGCGDKPALLKAGAETLSFTFRLAPTFEIVKSETGNGHREYQITCIIKNAMNGMTLGSGVGSCSTMESKYRWRNANRKCPECGKEAIIKGKADFGGGWICFGKKGGCGAKWKDGDAVIEGQEIGRVENQDIADQYNTVLKMAKKRAHVDAILTVTAASDIFTQDIEELVGDGPIQTEATVTESNPMQQAPKPPSDDLIVAKTRKYAAECDTIEKLAQLKQEMKENKITFTPEILQVLTTRYEEINAEYQQNQMDQEAASAAERDGN